MTGLSARDGRLSAERYGMALCSVEPLAVAAVSFKLAESYHTDGLSAALIGVGAFAVLTPTTEDFGFSMTWLGAQGLFVGLIVALLSTEVFRLFSKMRN
ncbi:hypothetical protein PO124_12705 [Bacillus licheniformis]|nr:hypothetical protein [Bacillus licheniformis]